MTSKNIYSDDYAIKYEYLIRKAHKCTRYGVQGADSDTFRRLIRKTLFYKEEMDAIKNNEKQRTTKTEKELLSEYMASAGEISGYIKTATDKVKKKHDSKLSDSQYQELESIEMLLTNPTYEKIVESINRTHDIMHELKLVSG